MTGEPTLRDPQRTSGKEAARLGAWDVAGAPLIQARAVSMPPAVVILSQLVLGAVFGLLGLALATPLAAAATVPLRHMFGIGSGEAGKAKVASK
jgi:hypothetical protein